MQSPNPVATKESIPLETMKVLEEGLDLLLPLYEAEELSKVEELSKSVWNRALQIYQNTTSESPFYIIFMSKPVGERFQEVACGFLVNKVKYREQNPSVLKDCLVWFCDKQKGIFELETCACDSKSIKHEIFPCLFNKDPF